MDAERLAQKEETSLLARCESEASQINVKGYAGVICGGGASAKCTTLNHFSFQHLHSQFLELEMLVYQSYKLV